MENGMKKDIKVSKAPRVKRTRGEKTKKVRKQDAGKTFKAYLMISLGSILLAIGVYFFDIQNGFSMGGVSGLGTVLGKITPISAGIWIIGLNVLLLLLGFIFLGKATGIRTVYSSLLFSGVTELLEIFLPLEGPLTKQPVIELVCSIMLSSLALAIVFKYNASTGGTDILALILQKKTRLDVGKALMAVDLVITLSAFFVFSFEIGLFSMVGLLVRTFFIDAIIDAFDSCKYFIVITSKPDEITHYVLNSLDHGATIVNATGAYSGESRIMLHTVCKRREAYKLKKAVREIDPSSFVIVTTSSEIFGEGFRRH